MGPEENVRCPWVSSELSHRAGELFSGGNGWAGPQRSMKFSCCAYPPPPGICHSRHVIKVGSLGAFFGGEPVSKQEFSPCWVLKCLASKILGSMACAKRGHILSCTLIPPAASGASTACVWGNSTGSVHSPLLMWQARFLIPWGQVARVWFPW